VAIAPTEIPLTMDKDRVACETTFYTKSGKTLLTLNDTGAQVNLVDKKALRTWKPGIDYVEYRGDTPELHGFGTIEVDQRRIIIMQIKCYEGGPIVRIPALVADLKGFNVTMFIGLPGLRHMRANLDLSDPDKMVLDTGRGGCRHTITVSATGKQQAMVEPTADQLPQPTRKLGLPPGHTSEGFVNAEPQDGHDGVAAPLVGAVALYDFLPDDVYSQAVRTETSELRESPCTGPRSPCSACCGALRLRCRARALGRPLRTSLALAVSLPRLSRGWLVVARSMPL
jgi:hypothetical protein